MFQVGSVADPPKFTTLNTDWPLGNWALAGRPVVRTGFGRLFLASNATRSL